MEKPLTTPGDEHEFASARPVVSQQLVHIDLRDERIQDVLERIRNLVAEQYPDAEFVSYIGANPLGIYLEVYTEGNEFDGILRVLSERLGNLNIAAGVNMCVVPLKKQAERAA